MRIARVLQARDDLTCALNLTPTPDVVDDIESALDSCALFLMASVDATARLAHRALELGTDSYNAGWQRERWLKRVAGANAALGELFSEDSEHARAEHLGEIAELDSR